MMRATNWALIFVAYLTLFSLGLLDNARGPYFADISADLSLSGTTASLFFAVTSTLAYIGGRFVPELSRRFGLLNTLRLGQALMVIGFASISLAQNLPSLILTCALFGYGFGLINVSQNLLIFEASSGAMRRRLLSGLHGMYAFSSLVSPLVAAQLFRAQVNWRQAFVGFAAFGVVSFFSTFFSRAHKRVLAAEPRASSVRHPDRKAYFLVGSMMSLYVIAEIVISTRLSLYLRSYYHYSADNAANALALFFLMLLVGRMYFLFVQVRATSLKIIEWSLVTTFIVFVLGLFVHPIFLTLCGLTMAPVFCLCMDFIAEHFAQYTVDAISSSLALSCIYIVSFHFIMGLLTDVFGIHAAMFVGLVALVGAYVLLQVFKNQQRHIVDA